MTNKLAQFFRKSAPSILDNAAFALLAIFASTAFSSQAKAANDYVLTCNPAQQMEIVAGQRVSSQEAFAIISFKPGRVGAAMQAPRPGECSWVDRGFRPNEPTKLYFSDNGKWVQSVCSSRSCAMRTNSRGIQTLATSIQRGRPFVLRAYNDGKGRMIITRVGP
ncbi:hypothetical protein [uncultured Cohaesibacter sp.]|uniref:hypothetical protein n=1 Tax=uncultured Cohaesibacter sp. TaxID=1002546 RepID=UPI0029C79050|nr:hypothetical protein [uncultured Cohaesibacter sp.]